VRGRLVKRKEVIARVEKASPEGGEPERRKGAITKAEKASPVEDEPGVRGASNSAALGWSCQALQRVAAEPGEAAQGNGAVLD
jgi:hypothetical protein